MTQPKDLDATQSWDYELPPALIAATPAEEREDSRLMVVDPRTGEVEHCESFSSITSFLRAGDLLVFNDARVVPARIYAQKSTGGKVELFVVKLLSPAAWDAAADVFEFETMTRSSKPLKPGQILSALADDATFEVVSWASGLATIRMKSPYATPIEALESAGTMPLPPYIVKQRDENAITYATDGERYQTVFARKHGAVAAPTAGLHFSESLLESLREQGVETAFVTLHVGPGTFRPVTGDRLSDHEMHVESYEISEGLKEQIEGCRARKGRIVAVGTTTVRTLESEALLPTPFEPGVRTTQLFLKPGSPFGVVDMLLTNFHLPRSTLLALVAAFAGYDTVMKAYAEATARGYRFYSYGDAMLLLENS